MDREQLNYSLFHALVGVVLFVLLAWGITKIPTEIFFLWLLVAFIFVLMLVINCMIIIGLTSFQYENTRTLYSLILPIYPAFLIFDRVFHHHEWWHYLIMIIAVILCGGIINALLERKAFVRSIECIAIIMMLFSSPFLYSFIY